MEFPAAKMNKPLDSPTPTQSTPSKPSSVLLQKLSPIKTRLSKLFQSTLFLIFCLLLIPLSKYLSFLNPFTNDTNSIEQSTEGHTFQISGYPLLFGPTEPNEIIKPIFDQKEYQYITLKNGLKVLMISDLNAEQSSAALVLEVGSSFEPYEIPGLAHLLEHILSIGSKNYDKSFYEKKVFASAAISREEAAFYYDRPSGDFEESLNIFIDPFINPRFDFEWYNPELYRIDEEFKEKAEVKIKRFFMAFRHLVDPESRFSRDYTGNLETLLHNPLREGMNVTRLLKEFFQAYYSSNLMSLVVLHNKPLEEMEKTIESSFSKIPNKELEKPSLDDFPLPLSSWNRHKILKYYIPATSAQEFEGVILFQICGIKSKSDAIEFILDVLKSDTEGSLATELKLLDWIFKMRTYFFGLNSDCGMLRLMFDLTIEGNNKFEGIVQTVFGYVKKFIEDGLTEELYNQHFYHRQYSFKYLQAPHDEESDRLRDQLKALAKNMLRYPKHRVLSKFEPYYNVKQRLAEAKYILEQMNTENLMLMKSVRPGFKGYHHQAYINRSVSVKDPEILENYDRMANLYYSVETVSKRSIKRWNRTKAENFTEFQFYRKNPYYPRNFSLVNYRKLDDEISKSLSKNNIVQIKKDHGVRIWYSPERNVEIPVVALYVKSRTMRSFEDQVLYKLMLDFLSPGTMDLYSPEVEGIRNASHSIEITPKFIKIEAFSENLPQIVDWVAKNYVHKAFDRLAGYNPSPHALLMFDYKFSMKYPSTSEEEAMRLVDEILVNKKCTSGVEIKESILKKVVGFLDDPNEFFEKKKEVLSDVEYLFYGNILPDEALKMAKKIGLNEGVRAVENKRVLTVKGENLVYRVNMLNLRKNESLVMNYYQGAETNPKNIAKLKILLNIMNRMILGLNIEKELNIKMNVHEHIKGNTTGFIISLQDKNFKHAGIDLFIENFLEDFVRIMHRASEEMIENEVKEASRQCTRVLESQPITFSNKVQEIFSHIDNEDYAFSMKQDVLNILKEITGKEYLRYMDDFFANCGKLSLQGFSRSLDFSDQEVLEAETQFTVKKQPRLIKTFADIII